MENAVCSGLKMQFDLPPVFCKNSIPLGKLLPHAVAGALQGGVVHIQISAFTVQGAALLPQTLQFLKLALTTVLQPFQSGVEHNLFALALLACQ